MNDADGVLLSVRAEARQLVAPTMPCWTGCLNTPRDPRRRRWGRSRQAWIVLPLTWPPVAECRSMKPPGAAADVVGVSSATREESYHDKETGRLERTGQVTATVALQVTVRDLDTLDDLGGVLVAHPGLNVHGVMWHVTGTTRRGRRSARPRSALPSARPVTTLPRWVPRCGKSSTSPTPACSATTPRPTSWRLRPLAPVPGSQEPRRSIPCRRSSSPPSRLASGPLTYPCRALKAIPCGSPRKA